MKFILSVFVSLLFLKAGAQTSYIQVNGEPGLSVYLNGLFKGKTTAEFNGLVIENVTAGQNLIRIVKDGYVPFEERIDVKQGEVLSYKVKPFSKHTITISEKGNSEATDKKANIVTGKLMVQSVPIEIKISIDGVEGADMVAKTKDQWTADNIPEGNYKMKFTFGGKNIEKNIDIQADETTRVFVNMMNGNITVTNSGEELATMRDFLDSLAAKFYFTAGITQAEFLRHNANVEKMKLKTNDAGIPGIRATAHFIDHSYYQKQRKTKNIFMKGFYGYIADTRNEVIDCSWILEGDNTSRSVIADAYSRIKSGIISRIPAAYWRELNNTKNNLAQNRLIISVPDNTGNTSYFIVFKFLNNDLYPSISVQYTTKVNLAEL